MTSGVYAIAIGIGDCIVTAMLLFSIFKKDDPTLFKNYRPISLLATLSKVLEKIIFIQLSSYFEVKPKAFWGLCAYKSI